MQSKSIAVIALTVAIIIFGCTAPVNNSGGLQPPTVCSNFCQVGQVQAGYPDCSCSGGGVGPMPTPGFTPWNGGGTGDGGNGNGNGGSGASGAGWGVVADDVLRGGAPAVASDREGMIVVFIGSKNANETPYGRINTTFGAVSAYKSGAGGGWSVISSSITSYDLKALDGKYSLLSQGRAGVGGYTRLLVEFRNLTVFYNESWHNVTLPKTYYVFVDMVPVSYGATSAVKMTFDLNHSISRDADDSMIFTPVIEIDSMSGVRYSVKDDDTVDLSAGSVGLRELAILNQTGGASYSIWGGSNEPAMVACTGECAVISSAVCHARCASYALGIIETIANSCDDGTAYSACSSNKPLYCVTGTYLHRCRTCGCPWNYNCLSDGTCEYNHTDGGSTCSGSACVSGNPPLACRNGQISQDCVACGCPEGKTCRAMDGVCVPGS